LDQAEREARALFGPPPASLRRAEEVGIDGGPVRKAWAAWSDGQDLDGAALTKHLENQLPDLLSSVAELRKRSEEARQLREDVWRPVAADLAAWLPAGREALRAAEMLPALKEAEAWVKRTAGEIRDQRFAPIANRSIELWKLLRQQSNVDLGRVALESKGATSTRRQVVLDVTVDGVAGAALGVMSQGELHSLALSLFLPRATLPESPFRFIVIDDPVQSMDPARVDGLARVLEETARTHQVVVFTHDGRLFESVRRIGIQAEVIEVQRRGESVVELREALDPVDAAIRDAMSLVKTDGLPESVGRRVVPGFCRVAVEGACTEVVRRRRLGRGEPHAEVEELLIRQSRMATLAALALFDDEGRGGDVLGRLNRWGRSVADTFQFLNKGVHQGWDGDLMRLVRESENLAHRIRELT
jgi:ABC-type lipoprotein export system ATPase subunit